MDMGLVMAAMMQKAAALQQQIGTSVLKSNLDAQKSNVLTLLGSAQQSLSLANVGSGVGGSLNISA
jgi:putative motility protein YjfB-like